MIYASANTLFAEINTSTALRIWRNCSLNCRRMTKELIEQKINSLLSVAFLSQITWRLMRLYCWELYSVLPSPNINKLIEKAFHIWCVWKTIFFFFSKKVTFKMYIILNTLRKPTWWWGEWEYLSRDELSIYW